MSKIRGIELKLGETMNSRSSRTPEFERGHPITVLRCDIPVVYKLQCRNKCETVITTTTIYKQIMLMSMRSQHLNIYTCTLY